MSRLFKRIKSNSLALGVYIKGGPHIVPSLAKAGFDFVRPDMMFSAIDWNQMDHIVRAALLSDITPWVRIAANPWLGGEDNLQVTVDAARAFSIGAEVVQVSVASAKQVEALLAVARDWHRSAAGYYPSSREELDAQVEKISREAMFVPSVESKSALREIESILSLDGLKAIFIACTDLADQLGHPFDYEHPEVWGTFDRIVKLANDRNIMVVANTGYIYKTRDDNARRVKQLYDHGARIVMIQGIEFLVEILCMDLLNRVNDQFGRPVR